MSIPQLFTNNLSIDVKLSKTQISKISQSGAFCDKIPWPLQKIGLPIVNYPVM